MGRPPFLRESRIYSFRGGRQDQKHLATLLRTSVQYDPDTCKSTVIRDALGIAAAHVREEEFRGLQALREELRQERERREAMEYERDKERQRADRLAQRTRKQRHQLARLVQHLPDVRRRVHLHLDFESGNGALDSLWIKCGRSWTRVQARLEAVDAELRGEPPPDPGGGDVT